MAANFKRSSDVIWEELADGALLISPSTGKGWTLNAAAAALWKYCDGTRSLGSLPAEMARFCDSLVALGLLRECRTALTGTGTMHFGTLSGPALQPLGLGSGPRRRPSPRGNSGPG